jgi:hypothetical protein
VKKLLFLLPLLASLSGSGQIRSIDHFWHPSIDTTQTSGCTVFSFAFGGQLYISFYDSGKNRHSYLDKDWLVDSGKVIIYGDTVTVIRNIVKLYLEQERKKDSIQRLLTNRGVILDMITGSAQTFKPLDSTIGIESNGDIYVIPLDSLRCPVTDKKRWRKIPDMTTGLAFDTSHVIESGCYFTFPNGKRITCDSLYVLFEKVSRYENKLDSLINEMRRFDLYRFWLDKDSLYKPGRSRTSIVHQYN